MTNVFPTNTHFTKHHTPQGVVPWGDLGISIFLRFRYGTVLPNVSKFVIFMCVLIKCCMCFDKCLSGVVKYVYFVVKLTLSQISQILLEFTHFIFTTIYTHLLIRTQHLPQNTQIWSKSTKSVARPKCSPEILYEVFPLRSKSLRDWDRVQLLRQLHYAIVFKSWD